MSTSTSRVSIDNTLSDNEYFKYIEDLGVSPVNYDANQRGKEYLLQALAQVDSLPDADSMVIFDEAWEQLVVEAIKKKQLKASLKRAASAAEGQGAPGEVVSANVSKINISSFKSGEKMTRRILDDLFRGDTMKKRGPTFSQNAMNMGRLHMVKIVTIMRPMFLKNDEVGEESAISMQIYILFMLFLHRSGAQTEKHAGLASVLEAMGDQMLPSEKNDHATIARTFTRLINQKQPKTPEGSMRDGTAFSAYSFRQITAGYFATVCENMGLATELSSGAELLMKLPGSGDHNLSMFTTAADHAGLDTPGKFTGLGLTEPTEPASMAFRGIRNFSLCAAWCARNEGEPKKSDGHFWSRLQVDNINNMSCKGVEAIGRNVIRQARAAASVRPIVGTAVSANQLV